MPNTMYGIFDDPVCIVMLVDAKYRVFKAIKVLHNVHVQILANFSTWSLYYLFNFLW